MTDTSIDSEKANQLITGRPLVGEYEKTIILVTGKPNIGKTSACYMLYNEEKMRFLSLDWVALSFDRARETESYRAYGEDIGMHIDMLCLDYAKILCKDFVGFLFGNYIMKGNDKIILVDGYALSIKELYSEFMKKCKENNIRVWVINRVLDDLPVMLNLGSGNAKINGYINIDTRSEGDPDICCDILQGLPFKDNSVDVVRADDFLEHIPAGEAVVRIMNDIWRVLKPGGIFDSSTPDCEFGQASFQDPFHVSFWCENSWEYYSNDEFRDLYGIKAKFDIQSKIRSPGLETNSRMYWIKVRAIAIKKEEGYGLEM